MHSEASKPSCGYGERTVITGLTCSIYARGANHGCVKCWDDRELGIADHVKLVKLRTCPNNTAYRPARIPAAPRPFDPSKIEICDFDADFNEVLVFRGENFAPLKIEYVVPEDPEECPIVLEDDDIEVVG
jgi:hypothetical protein